MAVVYIVGSLRNPQIPLIANEIQAKGHEAFADWFGAGPEADDKWREYEQARGKTYLEALKSYGARSIFEFDKRHIERSDAVILVAPAGKSGHMELGWALGRGKRGYYLLDAPDRWDVMLQFCTKVTNDLEEILDDLYAYSVQQTSQKCATGGGVCGQTIKMGEPVYTGSTKEGEGPRRDNPTIPEFSPFGYCPTCGGQV